MDRTIAIKKISEKFQIPENEIISLLEKRGPQKLKKGNTPRKRSLTPKKVLTNYQESQKLIPDKYLFTPNDFQLLKKQMEKIKKEIDRLGDEIGDSTGDTKTFHDNFEYEELGRQQRMWTNRLNELEKFNRSVEIVDIETSTLVISIGSRVKIEMDNGEMLSKKIGSFITFNDDCISYSSPFGNSLLGKKVGDKIIVKVKSKIISFTVRKIH